MTLEDLLKQARAKVDAMSPLERAMMHVQQRASFVRADCAPDAIGRFKQTDPLFILADRLERCMRALEIIAAFTDEAASAHLRSTGSFGQFDEPSAVQMARGTLADITGWS